MGRKGLFRGHIEPDGLVEHHLWKLTGRHPGKATLVIHSSDSEATIFGQAMPAETGRCRDDTGHRLDGIPNDLVEEPISIIVCLLLLSSLFHPDRHLLWLLLVKVS